MRALFLFFIFLTGHLSLLSQVRQEAAINNPVTGPGHTYAVVIGIANYESKNIPNLNFSNKDAQVFADYLQSKAGGSVPPENIRLLIDTNATTAAIYNALNWLRDKCETDNDENNNKNDLIYFYFSGHGDLETDIKSNLGFLLSFNTPANNYINNAVRIEDLNDYAHTLSVDFKANVVIITDACHSGKLAGSNYRGSYLVGKELSMAKEKEIRIASCAPEEVSQENEGWGGGRGVFSYYLLNGLKGLADYNRDSIVTLNEIKQYVDSCISNDAIMKENDLKQTPVLTGNDQFKLAAVNTTELLSLQRTFTSSPANQSNQDYFFSLLKEDDPLESVDYNKLNALPKEEIAFAFIKQVTAILDTNARRDKMEQLERSLKEDKDKSKSFNEDLAGALHTRGQKIINLYLAGDAAELERRRYYNSRSSGYDMYPVMYSVALKLVSPDNPLSQILKVNQYYFTGVTARLKMPTVEEAKQESLAKEAMAAQKQALTLQENAAYIHNELGILYQANKEYTVAEKYFKEATQLAPEWAIPWANLSGLYAQTKNFEKAVKAGETADGLQPGLQITNANLGVVNELSGNWLYAEEFYRKAIDINSRHYFPFERLGVVYMNTTQYAEADSFFHEADLRKKGYHFKGNDWEHQLVPMVLPAMERGRCDMDTLILKKDDIMAFFTWGLQDYYDKDYKNAERIFKRVIALDKKNPLVFHYMGKIFYDQHQWENAELMFKFATAYYLDTAGFNKYCDSVNQSKKYPYAHDCFESYFRDSYYERIEDYYFIATLYEAWAHYEEAEINYRKIIELKPAELGGYIKLWRMLEKLGRFTEAEKIIKEVSSFDKEIADRELNAFYRRTINQFPENGDWNYRLGLLLYERAEQKSRAVYFDTIVYFPLLNKELFMDFDLYDKLGKDPAMVIGNRNDTGSSHQIELPEPHEQAGEIRLPGIDEDIALAEPIYTPRKDGVAFLSKAAELLTETEAQADINFKIGNILVWSGSKKQAFAYYNKSVQLIPGNASARLNLIDVSKAIYKNRAALEQLNYLYDNQQINFPKRLLLAEFDIHSGQFEKAKKLLEEAQAIHPYVLPEIDDLMGRLNLLSGQPAQAISFYKNFLAVHINDNSTLYTIAKLYAQSGSKALALEWLEESLKNGFNYLYVLNNDPSWNDLRKTSKWKDLVKQFQMKKYPEPAWPL